MEAPLEVVHRGGDRFAVTVRGHDVEVDQPAAAGGEDTAPTPTELFIASLATCVAFYARRYLRRHGLPEEGLAADVSYALGDRPARVTDIRIALRIPEGVPAERRPGLLAVASHCTVHNTLSNPPEIDIELRHSEPHAA